jgi:tRNA(Arg) A34 adenosine deaminase TadA
MPPSTREADAEIIREIAAATRRGFASAHPIPYGAQIHETKSGERLVRALNRVVPDNDPTSHAEVRAIRLACRKLKWPTLVGYTLFTTCEPCPMCMTAALFAGIDRVVYGTVVRAPNAKGAPMFGAYSAKDFARDSALKCRVDGPIEEALCRALVDDPIVQKYKALCAKDKIRL